MSLINKNTKSLQNLFIILKAHSEIFFLKDSLISFYFCTPKETEGIVFFDNKKFLFIF